MLGYRLLLGTQKHTQALGGDVLFSFWPARLGALLFNIAGISPASSFKRKKKKIEDGKVVAYILASTKVYNLQLGKAL